MMMNRTSGILGAIFPESHLIIDNLMGDIDDPVLHPTKRDIQQASHRINF